FHRSKRSLNWLFLRWAGILAVFVHKLTRCSVRENRITESIMIRFACPHCQKKIKVALEGAGRGCSCPRCRRRLKVPAFGKLEPQPSSTSFRAGLDLAPSVVAASGGRVLFHCPSCGRAILLEQNDLSQRLKCAVCASEFIAPPPETEVPVGRVLFHCPGCDRTILL